MLSLLPAIGNVLVQSSMLEEMEGPPTVIRLLEHIAQRHLPQNHPQANALGVTQSQNHHGANSLPEPGSAAPTLLSTLPLQPEHNSLGSSPSLPT